MNKKAALYALGFVLCLISASILLGEAKNGNGSGAGISITGTSSLTPLDGLSGGHGYQSVTLFNCSSGNLNSSPTPACALTDNTIYFRLFNCGDTPAAATTTTGIPLAPGQSVTFTWQTNEGGATSNLYCAVAAITQNGTSKLSYVAK